VTAKRVFRRAAAILHYGEAAGEKTAVEFARALKGAFAHIARHPASGSPRWAHVLGLRDLRTWPLKGFPYLVFFMEGADRIDIWRVLHQERDIPKWMGEGS